MLSGGRGSGASSAPISTRHVEGRLASAPPPLPPDISEPPLSAHTTPHHSRQRRPRSWAQPPRPRRRPRRAESPRCDAPARRDIFRGAGRGARGRGAALTGSRARAIPRALRELKQSGPSAAAAGRRPAGRGRVGGAHLHAAGAARGDLPRVPPQRLQLAARRVLRRPSAAQRRRAHAARGPRLDCRPCACARSELLIYCIVKSFLMGIVA